MYIYNSSVGEYLAPSAQSDHLRLLCWSFCSPPIRPYLGPAKFWSLSVCQEVLTGPGNVPDVTSMFDSC